MGYKYIILATALYFVAVLAEPPKEKTPEELTENFKAQCEKNNGNFEDAYNAPDEFMRGIKFNETKKELEGQNETVVNQILFNSLCSNWETIDAYRHIFNMKTQKCYSTEERNQIYDFTVIVDELQKFVCQNEELLKLSSFIAEGGVACLEDKKEQLKQCWNKNLGTEVIDVVYNVHLSFNKTQCDGLSKLQTCVVEEVKKCSSNTAAIESVFNHLLTKVSPCKDYNMWPMTTPPAPPTTPFADLHTYPVSQLGYFGFHPLLGGIPVESTDCVKNGVSNENLEIAKKELNVCLDNFVKEIYGGAKNPPAADILAKFCPRKSELLLCERSYFNSIGACFGKEVTNSLYHNSLHFLEFICDNQIKITYSFISENPECIQHTPILIERCIKTGLQGNTYEKIFSMLIDKNQCNSVLSGLEYCVLTNLRRCSNPNKEIISALELLKKETCNPQKFSQSFGTTQTYIIETTPQTSGIENATLTSGIETHGTHINETQTSDNFTSAKLTSEHENTSSDLRPLCEKNDISDEKFMSVMRAHENCMNVFRNSTQIAIDLQSSTPNNYVQILEKSCQKKSMLISCHRSVSNSLENCFDIKEQANILGDINVHLIEFMCDRQEEFASFISENVECIQNTAILIERCVITGLQQDNTYETFFSMLIDKKQCNNVLSRIEYCAVNKLKKCSNPNIVASALQFLRMETCNPQTFSQSFSTTQTYGIENNTLTSGIETNGTHICIIQTSDNLTSANLTSEHEKESIDLKTLCQKNGVSGEKLNSAMREYEACTERFTNWTQILSTPNYVEIFKKLCQKKSMFISCQRSFFNSIENCFEKKEHANIYGDIYIHFHEFLCERQERLAPFMSLGCSYGYGLEPQDECLYNALSRIQSVQVNPAIDKQQCNGVISELQHCVVNDLKNCSNPTIESAFEFIKNKTCNPQIFTSSMAQSSDIQTSGTQISGTQASGMQISGTHTSGTQISGTQTSGTQIFDTQTSGTQISGTQASGTQISGTQASGTQTSSTHTSGIQTSGVHTSGLTVSAIITTTSNSDNQNRQDNKPFLQAYVNTGLKGPVPLSVHIYAGLRTD